MVNEAAEGRRHSPNRHGRDLPRRPDAVSQRDAAEADVGTAKPRDERLTAPRTGGIAVNRVDRIHMISSAFVAASGGSEKTHVGRTRTVAARDR